MIHFRAAWTRSRTSTIIRSLFRFGLPTGVQGIAMNIGGVLLLRFIGSLEQSAAAQAAYAVGYTELFSLITWTSVGLMGAAATIAGPEPRRRQSRSRRRRRCAWRRASGLAWPPSSGALFVLVPGAPAGDLRHDRSGGVARSAAALAYLSVSGLFITVALSYTGGLQGTGDTRSPLYISIVSQIVIPLGMCTIFQPPAGWNRPISGWRSSSAT